MFQSMIVDVLRQDGRCFPAGWLMFFGRMVDLLRQDGRCFPAGQLMFFGRTVDVLWPDGGCSSACWLMFSGNMADVLQVQFIAAKCSLVVKACVRANVCMNKHLQQYTYVYNHILCVL